jgi:DNA-binding LacI/PurR family transcriptional regulator
MTATMRDVARVAGVSTATVSFVINNTKKVSPTTRQRVTDAMATLGYRRNNIARALASRRTRVIALTSPFHGTRPGYALRDLVVGATQAAAEADYRFVVWPAGNDRDTLTALVNQHVVDGVIVMAVSMDDQRVNVLEELGMPYALIGRTRDLTGYHYTDIDFDETLRLAIDHLLALGHRQIAYVTADPDRISHDGYSTYVRTQEAYLRQVTSRGLNPQVIPSDPGPAGARMAVRRLLALAPDTTAVLALAESGAPGVLGELVSRGYRVPHDLSVVSLLGAAEVAALTNPTLTTVTIPGELLGRLGVQALLHELTGREAPSSRLSVGNLVVGQSTGPRPSRGDLARRVGSRHRLSPRHSA